MAEPDASVRMTIGALSRATGIPSNTLRTWERRYGFPTPARTDGGQREYLASVVRHLRLVADALERGHRARQVMSLDIHALEALLGSTDTVAAIDGTRVPEAWISAVKRLDGPGLESAMRQEQARHGAVKFVLDRVAPFLKWVGDAWSSGEIAIHQEHFASDHVRSVLDTTWRSLAPNGPPDVVCATLPGELHDLGLYMAAVVIAASGGRPLVLPGSTPVEEIARSVERTGARKVAISLSASSTNPSFRAALIELRQRLPATVRLRVGGAGAPHDVPGVDTSDDLAVLGEPSLG